MEGKGGQWSDPVNLDVEGTDVRIIEHRHCKSTLLIHVKRVTSVQKQVPSFFLHATKEWTGLFNTDVFGLVNSFHVQHAQDMHISFNMMVGLNAFNVLFWCQLLTKRAVEQKRSTVERANNCFLFHGR